MKALIIAAGAGALALAGLLGSMDKADDAAQHYSYCQLVTMWEADKARGVDVYDRKGHPNFNRLECK